MYIITYLSLTIALSASVMGRTPSYCQTKNGRNPSPNLCRLDIGVWLDSRLGSDEQSFVCCVRENFDRAYAQGCHDNGGTVGTDGRYTRACNTFL
ncbi:hypothetical protein PTTW11_03423 [Pyrenophora teres f. teres]|uniref:Uncharacterized protein n=1 Tax=Pyrenophora teres f. teres TaxID=97479 RepID=A0A6S6VUF5_9PLEO|nr:hypothetical protein PTTW11_03423 [Pyrenophora teres f. teres]